MALKIEDCLKKTATLNARLPKAIERHLVAETKRRMETDTDPDPVIALGIVTELRDLVERDRAVLVEAMRAKENPAAGATGDGVDTTVSREPGTGSSVPVVSGLTESDTKAAEVKPALSTAEQELKALLDDMDDGAVRSQPVGDTYTAPIPAGKLGAFVSVAQKLIEEGIETPERLAESLTRINPAFRRFSAALWGAFTMAQPSLAAVPDWQAIYTALDKGAKQELGPAQNLDQELEDYIITREKKAYPKLPEGFWTLYRDLIRSELLHELSDDAKRMMMKVRGLSFDTAETNAFKTVADIYNSLIGAYRSSSGTFGYVNNETEHFAVSADGSDEARIYLQDPGKFEGVRFGNSWSSEHGDYISVQAAEMRDDNTLAAIYSHVLAIEKAAMDQEDSTDEAALEEPSDEGFAAREIILSNENRQQKSHRIRKLAEQRGETVKETQEYIEAELVRVADEIARANRTDDDKFRRLVDLYNKQPLFSARTSTSVENQAYSTPAPMAFALRHMTGVTTSSSVYDATGGNGMLLIGADLENSGANEIDPGRRAALEKLGLKFVTGKDATKPVGIAKDGRKVDTVHLNPPFGSIPNVNFDGFGIKKLEHIISLQALQEAMRDNGTAAIILGAKMENTEQRKGAQWVFENYLYGHYNVVDNFEVSGDLYAGQGAAWPVRILVIAGRKASPVIADLAPKNVDRLSTWDDVWNRAQKTSHEVERQRQSMEPAGPSPIPAGDSAGPTATTDTGEVPGGTRPIPAPTKGGGKRGGNSTSQSAPGGKSGAGSPGLSTGGTISGTGDSQSADDAAAGGGKPAPRLEDRDRRGDEKPADAGTGSETGSGAADTARKDRGNALEATATQVPYIPESQGRPFETLIPRGIAESVRSALEEITRNRGQIDTWVADNLGLTERQLHDAEAAEQVDGVAMAMYQMETGGALIIGDETGIGKGRQAASAIRYAIRNGKIPVFFTKDPKLFSDMTGDLTDIKTTVTGPNANSNDLSVRPLVLGDVQKARIVMPDGTVVVTPPSKKQQDSIFSAARRDGFREQGYNAIFATYSQINKENNRQGFLEWLAANDDIVLIMDESHESAGDGQTSMQAAFMMGGEIKRGKGADKETITKAGVLNAAGASHPRGGVVYLSATFAKRADNMPVYFRTDLRRASDSFGDVVKAMEKGGVALQQAVTEALAEAGQYIRRERDFTGVSYDMKRVEVADKEGLVRQVDQVTNILSEIVSFSRLIKGAVQGSTAMTDSQIAMTDFASIVHNQIGQLLLAAKADAVVEEVLAAQAAGEKPIVALMNTMESFLADYTKDTGIKPGERIMLNWQSLLEYALSRTLRVSKELPNGDTVISTVNPADYGLDTYFNRIRSAARGISVKFPVSPIDYIIQKARAGGLTIGELTGRESGIEYSNFETGEGIYRRFKRADKNTLVNGFNSGALTGLLLNASGSTGLSIHASTKFKDTKPRHMIIAQPALDINVFIQTLGRIKRTGLVLKGTDKNGNKYGARYSHMVMPLNAELRPAVMAARKMKSLNANTTGESDSAVKIEAEDLMNRFGDRAVAEYLERNPELAAALDLEVEANEDGDIKVPKDIARKFTGRMSLRPDSQQSDAYAEITQDYRRAVEQAKVTGDYDLEIITHDDWDGVLASNEQITPGTDESSIFTASVNVQNWEITDNRPTPSGADMVAEFQKETGGVDALHARWREFVTEADARVATLIETTTRQYDKVKAELAALPEGSEIRKGLEFQLANLGRRLGSAGVKEAKWRETKLRMDNVLDYAGQAVLLQDVAANDSDNGMMTAVKFPDISDSLRLAPSGFKFTYLLNRPGGRVYPSLAQFKDDGYVQSRSDYSISGLEGHSGGRRERRNFIVGNPIRGYAATGGSGKVVRFKARDGQIVTGLMMPRSWNISRLASDPRMDLVDGAAVQRYMDSLGWGNGFVESGENARIGKGNRGIQITVPAARRTGGDIFLDEQLRDIVGDFNRIASKMIARVNPEDVARVANRITQITGKRFRGQEMKRVRTANGQEEGQENETPKARPQSEQKARAAKEWRDHIEKGNNGTIRTQDPEAWERSHIDFNDALDALDDAGRAGESTGNPDYSGSQQRVEADSVDQMWTQNHSPETVAQWKQEAGWIRESMGDAAAIKMLREKVDAGRTLSPQETKLAQMLMDEHPMRTAEQLESFRSLRMAWRLAGRETARAMRARVDEVMTPAERWRAYLKDMAVEPSRGAQASAQAKRRDAGKADTPAQAGALNREADAIEDKSSRERTAKLMKDLAKSKMTLEEWLNTDVRIVRDAPVYRRFQSELAEWKRSVLDRMQGGSIPFNIIAKQLGRTEKEVRAVRQEFEAKFRAFALANMKPGMTADELLKLASSAGVVRSQAVGSADAATEAVIREAMMKMGLVPEEHQGKTKVVTRRSKDREKLSPDELAQRIMERWKRNQKSNPSAVAAASRKYAASRDITDEAKEAFVARLVELGVSPEVAEEMATEGRERLLAARLGRKEKYITYVDLDSVEDVVATAQAMGTSHADGIDMVKEYWYNSLLSGWKTQLVNAVSNPIHATLEMGINQTVAAFLNKIGGAVGGGIQTLVKGKQAGGATWGGNDMAPHVSEIRTMLRALFDGKTWADAFMLGGKAWKTGNDFLAFTHAEEGHEVKTKDDFAGMVKMLHSIGLEVPRQAIPGLAGKIIRTPSSAMQMMDVFMKTIIANMAVTGYAMRIARRDQRGVKFDSPAAKAQDFDERVQAQAKTVGSEAWKLAVRQANEIAFQSPLDGAAPATNSFDSATNSFLGGIDKALAFLDKDFDNKVVKALAVVLKMAFLPFRKVPLNIARIGLRKTAPVAGFAFSPILGLTGGLPFLWRTAEAGIMHLAGKKGFTQTYGKFYEHAAEQLIAFVLYALISRAAEGDDDDDTKDFLITGGMLPGKYDRQENMARMAQQGSDYTIRIGDREHGVQIPFGRIEPVATVLGSIVDMARAAKMDPDVTTSEKTARVMGGLLSQIESKTFLQGLSNLMGVWRDVEGGGADKIKDFGLRTLAGLVVPNILKQPVRDSDPYLRDWRDRDWTYHFMPVGDGQAQKKLNPVTGDPVLKEGGKYTRIAVPTGIDTSKPLPTWAQAMNNYNNGRSGRKFDEGGSWAPGNADNTIVGHPALPKGASIELKPEAYEFMVRGIARETDRRLAGVITPAMAGKPDKEMMEFIMKEHAKASSTVRDYMRGRPPESLGTVKLPVGK